MKHVRFPEPDRLRGVAILFVVAIHAFSYLRIPTGGAWPAVWFVVHQTAVPAFFLADGWLYGKRRRQAMSSAAEIAFLSASARRLLAPWLVFSLVYLALRLVTQALGVAGGAPVQVNSAGALVMAIWHGAAAEGLYFLPALMIVRLVTPRLHRLAAGSPIRATGLAILLMVGWRVFLEPRLPVPAVGVDPLLAGATGLCFAAVGWALAEAPARFSLPAAIVPAVLLAAAGVATEGRAAAMGFQTSAVLVLWALAVAMPARLAQPPEWLGRRTMEIYLLHAPFLIKVVCVAAALLPPALGLPVAVAGSTAGALALAAGLDRFGLGWLWDASPGRAPARSEAAAAKAVGRSAAS
ncbi:acyltransferase family protein [Roseiarcus fermentans]|uniref:acyltransferase family protein n=1 Tax=Roseiarcus fermentans TaxID=1473586 RepID=UPI00147344F4|nr:acyltransferase [Roseiarcus fermentans]